ncbi:hypothetical protein ACNO5E_04805 [Vibrio parahaemolyticus]
MNYDAINGSLIECGLIMIEFFAILAVLTFIGWKRGAFNGNN